MTHQAYPNDSPIGKPVGKLRSIWAQADSLRLYVLTSVVRFSGDTPASVPVHRVTTSSRYLVSSVERLARRS